MSETNSGQNQDKMDKTETKTDKKFQCPYCGRFYKNKVSLEKHIKRFHKDVAENNDIEIEIEKPEPVKKKSEEKKEDKKDNKMIYIVIGITGLVLVLLFLLRPSKKDKKVVEQKQEVIDSLNDLIKPKVIV